MSELEQDTDDVMVVAEARRGWRTVPRPFVKWVGGKARLAHAVLPLLDCSKGRYHEPFVGGGAIFFALAQAGRLPPGGVRLTDGNRRLVRTWRGIRDDLDGVVQRLEEHKRRHDKQHFYAVRAVDIDADDKSDADVAAWFIYLNKTGFNGLYRVNRSGGFNVPMGSYKRPRILDLPNLRAVSDALQDVDIEHEDFTVALGRVQPGDTVYIDPPYVPLSRTASFTDYTAVGFGKAQQEALAERALALKQAGACVVLSNHDIDDVHDLYPAPFRKRSIQVRRPVNSDPKGRGGVAELIIY